MERDSTFHTLPFFENYFNSHAHVERDNADDTKFQEIVNFNSHAHVERDSQNFMTVRLLMISTHTLTWSVTFFAMIENRIRFISTHTLTWSVTR